MEYKAISQASYKFTSTRETTIQGADVLNSGFRFGTIKTTNGSVFQIAPSDEPGSYTTKNIRLYALGISSAYDSGYTYGKLDPCTVDNKTYYGTKSYKFNLGRLAAIGLNTSSRLTLKDGILKVLRYDSSIENIVFDEYSTNGISSSSMSSSANSYDSYIELEIYKQKDDIILAVWWEEEATETTNE